MSGARGHNTVYVMRAENGLYKIGVTNDIKRRLEALRAQSPQDVQLHGLLHCENADEVEKMIHCDLYDVRHHGEWFSASGHQIGDIMYNYGFTLIFGNNPC